MSKMKNISIEIQERLDDGIDPEVIAKVMEIPIRWVHAEMEAMDNHNEDYDPYNTINS